MTTATVLLWRVTGSTSEISMELWGSWISLVGSPWYSQEAKVYMICVRCPWALHWNVVSTIF
jgi:hypothetical protein